MFDKSEPGRIANWRSLLLLVRGDDDRSLFTSHFHRVTAEFFDRKLGASGERH
jgi:hypothetical protein